MIKIAILVLNLILGNQPYSITLENKPSEFVTELCIKDSNCMDLETFEDRVTVADYRELNQR